MKNKNIFSYLEPSAVIVALFCSVVITWFMKDFTFNLIFSGKSLSGRSVAFQVGFSFVLFLLLAVLFLVLFKNQIQWIINNSQFAFATIACIPLLAFSYMGGFSRFVADDFSSATLAVNKGVLGATVDWYVNWSGRFTASFFDSLAGYLGPSVIRWETGIAILLLLIGLSFMFSQIFTLPTRSVQLTFSVILSSIF
jgi:hypothetical protein